MDNESPFGSTRRIERDGREVRIVELKALALRVTHARGQVRRVVLDLPLVRIGKAPDNDVVLADDSVSRYHLVLTVQQGHVMMTDSGSTNGTFIDGVRVREAVIPPGTIVTLGETRLEVESAVRELRADPTTGDGLGHLVGSSEAMRQVYGFLGAVADSSVTVILLGETGTGKEMTARTLHDLSGRRGSFVVFDCASTGPDLIRSELFGHETGAFTGADRARPGAFRRANGGTLFIDEIGELPLDLQPKLLRVLEAREVQPLGRDEPVPVDVRVVAATHRDLAESVRAGRFREDLYHRLAVVPILLPPLRQRPEDILVLIDHFVKSLKLTCRFTPQSVEAMQSYPWPGNIRALRNVVERCGILCRGRDVRPEDLGLDGPAVGPLPPAVPFIGAGPPPLATTSGSITLPSASAPARTLAEVEKHTILSTLEATGGRRRETARVLGISITTLRRKLREYGIGPSDGEDSSDEPE